MKPEPYGHSYVVTATLKEFEALPSVVPAEVGACARGFIADQPHVRRREALSGGGTCITHYPLNLKEADPS